MRWGGFALALLAAYLLQCGVFALWGPDWIDLFLMLALLCGLAAPRHDARIAAWIVGITQDLASPDILGIHALSLGLVGLTLTILREMVNIGYWWPRLIVSFLAAGAGQAVYTVYLWQHSSAGGFAWDRTLLWAVATAVAAALTVVLLTELPVLARMRHDRRFRGVRH